MAQVDTSDKNFYDRSYLNAINPDGDLFLVSGFGVYPNLGVVDAFAIARKGDRQWAVRFSDALEHRSLDLAVGDYRIEVVEPLCRLRVVCGGDDGGLGFDLTWEATCAAVQEPPHLMMSSTRPILDASRFAQTGAWSGTIAVDGEDVSVTPDRWMGTRDRSWGIRPVGDPDPAGRTAEAPTEGFWWLYLPLRFEGFSIIVIAQENPDGFRILNDATRIWDDGRIEQLGWPRIDIDYRSGTRRPDAATIHLTDRTGTPVTIALTTRDGMALHVGGGYGGDPDWSHGQWRGRGWVSRTVYDLTDPAVAGRIPYGVNEYPTIADCDGVHGVGMFEHGCFGRHDPSGFADWSSVAP
ncbi:hypothetical protein [Antrihabitans cavernicola]|nr:hypothetical protein [Spelaeibacter cavernicola]